MEQRVSLITLGVADLKASRRFYDSLGWKAATKKDDENIVCYDLQSMALALHPWSMLAKDANVSPHRSGASGITLAHNVSSKEDVADILAKAEQAGAKIIKQPQDTEWGGFNGYFADPDGYLWEVAYNPFSPLGANGEFQWAGAK